MIFELQRVVFLGKVSLTSLKLCASSFFFHFPGCDKGFWGENCEQQCDCVHGVCSPFDGSCTCDSGYEGDNCDTGKLQDTSNTVLNGRPYKRVTFKIHLIYLGFSVKVGVHRDPYPSHLVYAMVLDSIMMLVKFLTSANQKHRIWSCEESGLWNPRPRLLGVEVAVGPSLMFRKWVHEMSLEVYCRTRLTKINCKEKWYSVGKMTHWWSLSFFYQKHLNLFASCFKVWNLNLIWKLPLVGHTLM